MIALQSVVLILSLVHIGRCQFFDKNCKGIDCQAPPSDAKCETVDDTDKAIPQPTGPKAKCCPLWKCKRENDKDFFTFHGLLGAGKGVDGSETVRYENTGQMGRSVSSSADGGHDSTASAGDKMDIHDLNAALKEAGVIF